MIGAVALMVKLTDSSSSGRPSNTVGHVVRGVDGHAHPADLVAGQLVAGVVAELGRQVERDRQRGLALAEQEPEAGVGVLGGAEPGELAHGPQLVPVHGRVRPAGERRLAGRAQRGGRGSSGGPYRGDRDAGVGGDHGGPPSRAPWSRASARSRASTPATTSRDRRAHRRRRRARPGRCSAATSWAGIVPPTTSGMSSTPGRPLRLADLPGQRQVHAGQDRDADHVGVLGLGRGHDLRRSLAQSEVDDLGAGVTQRHRDHLHPPVVAVESRLGQHHPHTAQSRAWPARARRSWRRPGWPR